MVITTYECLKSKDENYQFKVISIKTQSVEKANTISHKGIYIAPHHIYVYPKT